MMDKKEEAIICPNCGKKIDAYDGDGTVFKDAFTGQYAATVCDSCYSSAEDESVYKAICGDDCSRALISLPAGYVLLGGGYRGFYESDRDAVQEYVAGKISAAEAEGHLEHDDISQANVKELMRSYAEYDRRMESCCREVQIRKNAENRAACRRYIVIEEDGEYGISISDVYRTLEDAKTEMRRRLEAYFEKYHLGEGCQNDASDMPPEECIKYGHYGADDYSLEIRETKEAAIA